MPEFKELAEEVKQSGKPKSITVRELMRSIGQLRRGKHVNRKLRTKLTYKKLTTVPDFELVSLDSTVLLQPKVKTEKPTEGATAGTPLGNSEDSPLDDQGENKEVVLTIGQLPSADRKPRFIKRDEPISRAITFLLQDGVSHLVVSQNSRSADGIITWESIGKASAGPTAALTASDCMELQPLIVRYDKPLFDAVRDITQRGTVLVQSTTKEICGSVTSADIAEQFVSLSEPFLFLEQIENHLRVILRRANLSQEEVKGLADPRDEKRQAKVKTVDDLTFGETMRAFERQEIWDQLKLKLDRKSLVERLKEINEIRNSVMHFHPDGITAEDRTILRTTREMLQIV